MHVLVIGSRMGGSKNDPVAIARSLKSDTTSSRVIFWEDMVFSIKTGEVIVTVNDTNILSQKPDLVIGLGWYKNGKHSAYRDTAYSLALYLTHEAIPFWNSEMGMQRSTTKVSCLMALALEGIPVPDTYFSLTKQNIASAVPTPYIAKAIAASRGKSNYLVEQESPAWLQEEGYFMVEPFLPNDHDLRVICFNGKPSLVLRRSRAKEATTHLNNTSQGGEGEWLELDSIPAELLTISEKICRVTGREMAGIDFIPDINSAFGGYSCLEVNAIPQLTSGRDTDTKMNALKRAVDNL